MTCSYDDFEEVWRAIHKNPFDTLYVPRKPLEAVFACHRQIVGHLNELTIITKTPARTAKDYHCRSNELTRFMIYHGRICDCPEHLIGNQYYIPPPLDNQY